MYKELEVSSDIPESKLHRAFKNGVLTLSATHLKGKGATLHLHPESYARALKARKAGKGTRLQITRKEIGYPFKHLNGGGIHGGSIWGKIWGGIKKAFNWAKDSGVLSKAADALAVTATPYVGGPGNAAMGRSALKSLTGIGVDAEGGKIQLKDVKKRGKQAVKYMKDKGILTDIADQAEKYLLSKATKPEHEDVNRTVRGEVKKRYGVGLKGTEQSKQRMALVRAARGKKGGSFTLG
ncbi:hypothetical protein PHYSODRAFT_534387 [Phytophthora sojae]|uniref:Uncharacterized protein n=1 Tax=Phytophthora sojae (strain P6497) TaxID=1094619 RepID=G5AGJ0_PHYSP|nr:hypothetical protein PHYSODRAFT_534387 [Phytophthora sojae]EGZ05270.1 hypothetical protein PHYSODRAFT_534387 [Phytophthora sojae]|eukprot:XP_009539191.1 hypothetical protein PHYSODRAFT_534387 [Phytophthora sojae]